MRMILAAGVALTLGACTMSEEAALRQLEGAAQIFPSERGLYTPEQLRRIAVIAGRDIPEGQKQRQIKQVKAGWPGIGIFVPYDDDPSGSGQLVVTTPWSLSDR